MVEDVARVVFRLYVDQPVVNEVAVCLADPVGTFVSTEEVDVDAFAETAEVGEVCYSVVTTVLRNDFEYSAPGIAYDVELCVLVDAKRADQPELIRAA